jgi:probable F420-dependent oxidoreductase
VTEPTPLLRCRPMIEIPTGSRVVGFQLPVQAQSAYFVAEWERSAGPDEMARIVTTADNHGYFYVGVCDHVSLPESVVGGMGTHWVDPISTLGWIAAITEHIGLLTHVYVLPYRHPLMAAKQFATIDHLSKGRMICGIGAGHVEAEFQQLGVDFAGRGKYVDQSVPLIIEALEQEFVNGFGARPRPVQSPRPPVWIAGSSPAAIRRAGRLADGWLPQGPSTPEMVALLEATRAEHGRADRPMMIGHITPFLHVGDAGWDLGDGVLAGSPSSIAERILEGTPAGVNQLQVRFKVRSCEELCDQLVAFAAEVAPLVQD